MNLNDVTSILEKVAGLSFESTREREEFLKVAQGMMDPSMVNPNMIPQMDPVMAAQAAGIAPIEDPSMQAQAMPQQGAPVQEQAMPQEPAQPAFVSPEASAMAVVGEGISNKDIESLVKVINVITSLKSQYDAIKKDQMAMLKSQLDGSGAQAEQAGPQQ